MMRWAALSWATLGCMMFLSGCGSAEPPKPAADAAQAKESPDKIVFKFLEAVRTGNDEAAANALSPLARKLTSEKGLDVAPQGSDTASFKVGEVEMVGEGGAHVASTWTDMDDEGKPHTDSIVWMVRQEDIGWRVVGMATRLFPNEPPLFLNFEDPDDMIRKQQMAQAEFERRAQLEEAGVEPRTASEIPRNAANAKAPQKQQMTPK